MAHGKWLTRVPSSLSSSLWCTCISHMLPGIQQKSTAGGRMAALEPDQVTLNNFRAYFHLNCGHWINCSWGHTWLFKHLTIIILSCFFPDVLETCFFLSMSSLLVLLIARAPCLEFGPQNAALVPPVDIVLSPAPLQTEMLPCPPFLPETHLQHTFSDMGHRGS